MTARLRSLKKSSELLLLRLSNTSESLKNPADNADRTKSPASLGAFPFHRWAMARANHHWRKWRPLLWRLSWLKLRPLMKLLLAKLSQRCVS